jgi:hypothetical protein
LESYFFTALSINAQVNTRNTYVNGYYKSNGTYVEGHYRTMPNNTMNDNYSTYPNVNPHTEKQGTIQPNNYYSTLKYHNSIFSTPTYQSSGYASRYRYFLNKNLAGTCKNLYI